MKRHPLPCLVCIGAQKAGTSWLYQMLRQNPSVWASPFKELHFFDYKFVSDSKKWAKWHVKSNIRRMLKENSTKIDGLEQREYLKSLAVDPILNGVWYKKVFSIMPSDKKGFDVTPEYCQLPEDGIIFLKKFLTDLKVIYIIRDPVERALSQIRMNMTRDKESFADVQRWIFHANQEVVSQRGDYRAYIPRWDKHLKDGVLYMPFSQISKRPSSFLAKVEKFYGLDNYSYKNTEKKVFGTNMIPEPRLVRDALREKFDCQYQFLSCRFDQSFLHNI